MSRPITKVIDPMIFYSGQSQTLFWLRYAAGAGPRLSSYRLGTFRNYATNLTYVPTNSFAVVTGDWGGGVLPYFVLVYGAAEGLVFSLNLIQNVSPGHCEILAPSDDGAKFESSR